MKPTIFCIAILFCNAVFSQQSMTTKIVQEIDQLQIFQDDFNDIMNELDMDEHKFLRENLTESVNVPVKYRVKVAADVEVFVDNKIGKLNIVNPNNKEILKLRVYDLKGDIVMEADQLETTDNYQYNLPRLDKGVYVASLKLADNERLNKKLFVNKIR